MDTAVPQGGGGPYDAGMEARISALEMSALRVEAAVARISDDVAATRREMGDVRKDMSELRKEVVEQGKALARPDGRVTNLPTAIQMILFVLAVFAFGLGRQFWGN
jgi:uncharacterized coiled-coil protein SlyX